MCSCTPPGTSQVYGQTRPTFTRWPAGRKGSSPRRRLLGRSLLGPGQPLRVEVGGEDPLQHVPVRGVRPDAPPRRSARVAGSSRRRVLFPVPCAGTGISSSTSTPQRSPSNHKTTGRAPRRSRRPAPLATPSSAPSRRRSPPRCHDRSRPGHRAGRQACRAEPCGQYGERLTSAAGRQHLHAQSLAERDEPVIQRFGLQPLHDRGERAGAVVDDPGPGLVLVAHVRQREDHAAALPPGTSIASSRCPGLRRSGSISRSRGITGSRNSSSQ